MTPLAMAGALAGALVLIDLAAFGLVRLVALFTAVSR